MPEAATVSVKELANLASRGEVAVIDVRTPREFRSFHAPVAKNVPLESLDPKAYMESQNGEAGKTLCILCRSGMRAEMAREKFVAAGFENIAVVEGGTLAWEAAGLPVNRGKNVIPVERQVRIVAGACVFAGALLTYFVNPYFFAVPTFFGAGLVFSGITGKCPMAMTIARMPWNQGQEECGSCCSGT